MGKLDSVLRQINKTDEPLSITVNSETTKLEAKIEESLRGLTENSAASRNEIATALLREIGKLALVVSESNTTLQARVNTLEGGLRAGQAETRDSFKSLLVGLESSVLKSIGDIPVTQLPEISIPETNLEPLNDMIAVALARIDAIQIPEPDRRIEEFIFTVNRYDGNDPEAPIKNVSAKVIYAD